MSLLRQTHTAAFYTKTSVKKVSLETHNLSVFQATSRYCKKIHNMNNYMYAKQNKNRSATRGAQLIHSGLLTIFLYNLVPNLIDILPKYKGGCHKLSGLVINSSFLVF